MKQKVNIMWFRRDLRLADNAALYHALKSENPVVPVFIFDKNILDDLEDKKDKRVNFIHETISGMQEQLVKTGTSLEVFYGYPETVFNTLLEKYTIEKVFTNRDDEQYAIDRDSTVDNLLKQHNAVMASYKDQVIFDRNEVVKADGSAYTVFTPYSKKWKAALRPFYLQSYPVKKYLDRFYRQARQPIPSLESMGFEKVVFDIPPAAIDDAVLERYAKQRDFPGIDGTSRLGLHLRFGTISIRELATHAKELSEAYLDELIWRDFYHMILWHFPHVRKGYSFKKAYDAIQWRNNEQEFEQWCTGRTGYPIVDAGMRELNTTGFMHNRVRMITASFLTKHLLIDWRWGEAYFAQKLLDYDYAANNGGWQWAAGSGCDAAPYFRVFNPLLQTERFDKDLRYVRKWVPELDSADYPLPVVDHAMARKRALEVYGRALKDK